MAIDGEVVVRRLRETVAQPSALGRPICPDDVIEIGANSRAALALIVNDTVLRLDQNTVVVVRAEPTPGRSMVDLLRGFVHFFARTPRSLDITTPFVNAAVEGTEFVIGVRAADASVIVLEGVVQMSNAKGALRLTEGKAGIARAGQGPQETVILRPRDAVRWAIYYPPTIASVAARQDPAGGNPAVALRRLDSVPAQVRDSRYWTYRAALLLSVGRYDEARADIVRARAPEPRNAEAAALEAVLALADDDIETALASGRAAVAADPSSAAAKIALSYALQARFRQEEAHAVLEEAVAQHPEDALAWARLAELRLVLGRSEAAREAAARAAALAPTLGRTQTMLGYAALNAFDPRAAAAAFERAIVLESSDPSPHLGLGLARIRRGDTAEGRRELEIAAALDPTSAVTRSYLGKAYEAEGRGALAATQYEAARTLDPRDPTPWLYDALLKQAENRPVEALREMERAIALNGNRAVYRSQFDLENDLVTRAAEHARIYRDLGFDQLALAEGFKAATREPTNYSAHRFLADTYLALPRHEIARDSELLQAQLLQPINLHPVQPRLSQEGLEITDDFAGRLGFNEYTRLFAGNGAQLRATGLVGSHRTLGDDVIVSGIYDNFSYSVGQFHYETNGVRDNNDLQRNIYNAFAQVALNERASVLGEVRSSSARFGDRQLLFNPNVFFPDLRQTNEHKSVRVGGRYDFTPDATAIAYAAHDWVDATTDFPSVNLTEDQQANGFEAAQFLRGRWVNLTAGVGIFEGDNDQTTELFFLGLPPVQADTPIKTRNAYLYADFKPLDRAVLTLGAAYDTFRDSSVSRDQFEPKLGLTWEVIPGTTLRAAAFRTLKRPFIASQTIERTNIAGFNQFFDDVNGTDARRYGVGVDQKLSDEVFAGAEYSQRRLKVPGTDLTGPEPVRVSLSWRERLGRAYVNWVPTDSLALSVSYLYERLVRTFDDPEAETTTHRVPAELRYFHPSGLIALGRGTYVHQRGQFFDATRTPMPGGDDFVTIDLGLGYRLPERRGLFTVEVKDLLNEGFRFQDTDTQNPTIVPGRLVLARFTVGF